MKYSLSLLSPLLLALFGVLKTKAFTTPSTPKVVSSTVAKDSLTSLKASTSNLYNIERYRGSYGGYGDYYPYGGGYNDYYYGNSYLPYYNNYNGYGGGYSTSLLARSPQADWYSPTRNSYYGNYYNNDWNRYGGYGGYGSYGNGYYGSGYGYGNGYYGNNWGYNGFLRPNNPDLSEKSPSLLNQADNMGYHGNFGEPRNAFARQYNRDMYYGMGYGGMGMGYGYGRGWGGNGYYNNGYYGNGYGNGYGYGGGYGGGYYNDYNRYQNTGYNY